MKSPLLRVLLVDAVVIVSMVFLNFCSRDGWSQSRSQYLRDVQMDEPQSSRRAELLSQTVKRAYAIDTLFHRVYTPTWEGANPFRPTIIC